MRFPATVAAWGAVGAGLAVAGGVGWMQPAAAGLAGGAALLGLGRAVVRASAKPELQVFGPAVVRARHPGLVALTIDDGPHPVSTPGMLRALADAGARATFFVLADRVQRHPDLLRDVLAAGHEVGLHGLTHTPWLTMRAPAAGAAELRRALAILAENGAPGVTWYRPPFGAVSPRLYEAARLAGLTVAWCSVRTGDGGRISADTLRARCARAVGTDIVLLHDGDRPTWRLLPELLQEWGGRGIRAGTLSDAMAGA